jgi:hypothetical protein
MLSLWSSCTPIVDNFHQVAIKLLKNPTKTSEVVQSELLTLYLYKPKKPKKAEELGKSTT